MRDGRLITPPYESSILGGVTRDAVIEIAEDLGIQVEERLFGRDLLYLADEVLLTGTAAEVTPVREIDGRTIGDGSPGQITKRLQKSFLRAICGKTPAYRHWLAEYDVQTPMEALTQVA